MNILDYSINKSTIIKNFLKANVNSILFLVLLTTIVSFITYYRVLIQMEMGPVSDSYDFLSNALVIAGQGMGYSDLLRPPFFPFIISLIFRLGYVSTNTIFAVDGGLFIFGVIGLFMLLKIRFNDLESFLGGLLYATFPIVLTVLSVGFSDLASVSFSIWAIYFTVLAVKTDSKFFYLVFPFAMFAFLTRYNSALLVFPIFLFVLINKDEVNFKNMLLGIIASVFVIVPVLNFFYQKFGSIISPFLNFGSTSTTISISTETAAYDPNVLFFVQKLPAFLGVQGITIILILVLGFGLYLFFKSIRNIRDKKSLFTGFSLKIRTSKIKMLVFIVLLIIFLGSFCKISYIVSEILFFVLFYIFYNMAKEMNLKYIDLNALILSWFLVFFIFHSIFVIKDNRYFVLMAPPVAYFMILGLSEISKTIKFKIRNRNLVFLLLTLFMTSLIILSSANEIPLILQANNDKVTANEQMELASQWFVNYDLNYKNRNIYSDLWPNFSWYLKTNVKPVPVFKNNQTFPNGVKNYTFSQQDSNMFNDYLKTNNADYYFCVRNELNLTSYTPIKEFGTIIIYKRKNL